MPALPSRCDSDNAPHLCPHYAPAAPSRYTSYASSSPLLTMLMLAWCPPNMPLTLPPHLPPHHSLCFHTSAAHNPYAPTAPSRYTSYAALNPPYAFSHLPNPLFHLTSLRSCSVLLTCLQFCPPYLPSSLLMLPHPLCSQSIHSCGTLKIYLLRCPQPSLRLILFTNYHPYAPTVSSQHASNAAPTLA
ncbi:hypothetical protein O181_050894 [Austropuccinia psidii MF-1]|uniref:Uncharacterized protein n=1 Tax=Austropuccinia psidii MF-1 TaxID=1389203 RepID=A0A9Q3HQ54_9BASI|nr:hypothetical protein [Austropuccinia psidii MF-1]